MRDPLNRNMPLHPSLLKDKGSADKRLDDRSASAPLLPGTPACKSILKAMDEPFAVVDLETTGLSPARDEIIEIGALLVDKGFRTIGEFSTLVKPRVALPPQITRLTGIDQELLDSQGIRLQDGFRQLLDFLGDRPVFAHNAAFDQSFLVNASAQCGLAFPNVMYDTICMAEAAWPELDSYALFSLAQRMGLGNSPAHRALADAKATLDVLRAADVVLRSPHRPKGHQRRC